MNKAKQSSSAHNKSKVPFILLALIIVMQLLWTGYTFVCRKNGCHSDEIWSYGLANSYYQPFIYMRDGVHIDDITEEDVINVNKWIKGDTLNDYITVQNGERFAYGSVYHNQTLDHHPPLYYMLLHTVCSFFPNKFSFAFGFFLNCIFLVLTQIFLFRISREIMHSDWAALLTPLLYGGSVGAMDTFTFIRQYSLLTMFAVIFAYYNQMLIKNFELKKYLIPVLLTAMGAFMTHYYGIIFIGVFTACICIYMLARRKIKQMFIYSFSMLGTLGLYFLLYPASIKQMLGSDKIINKDRPFTYAQQFRIFLSKLLYKLFHFRTSNFVYGSFLSSIIAFLVLFIAIAIPLYFLFRKEEWFIRFKKFMLKKLQNFISWLKKADPSAVFGMIASFAVISVVNIVTDIYEMGLYALRYLFITYPFFCLTAVLAVYMLLLQIPKIKKYSSSIVAVGAAVCIFVQNTAQTNDDFLFKHYPLDSKTNYAELFEGKNCVYIFNKKFTFTITCFCNYFYKADNVFFFESQSADENIRLIQESGIKVEYVFVDGVIFSDEELEMLKQWHNEDSSLNINKDSEDNKILGAESISKKLTEKQNITMKNINSLNNNAGYDFIGELNVCNGYTYLLKMH